jgi:hypothetical protein
MPALIFRLKPEATERYWGTKRSWGTNAASRGLTRMPFPAAPSRIPLLIAGLAVAAGCGGKPAPVDDPVPGVPLTQQRTITRSEVGYKWPFAAGVGTIACDGGALMFRAGGTTYALTRGAGTRGYANIDAIRQVQGSGPPSDPLPGVNQDVRMKLFAQSSGCGIADDNAGMHRVAECKARIRAANKLTESDLTRIEAEGAERFWPPLKPPLMSLEPLVEAARQLCPR